MYNRIFKIVVDKTTDGRYAAELSDVANDEDQAVEDFVTRDTAWAAVGELVCRNAHTLGIHIEDHTTENLIGEE